MRFSEAKNHKVVSTGDASTVGRVSRFVVDPATARVVALSLKKTDGDGDTLAWSDLTAFGRDAVTVPSAGAIVSATGEVAELAGKGHDLLGKRVLEETGVDLGEVKDVDFDPATGDVVSLLLKDVEVAGSRMIGLGSYALVVRSA